MKDDNYEEEDIYDACKGRDVDKWLRDHRVSYEVLALERKELEAKILQWYMQTKDKKFMEYFGITVCREGKIDTNG